MPLTVRGNLQVTASANLGGLGNSDGPAQTYNWVLPSVAPLLLPWLAILGLLALKSNRRAAAWLIWLPLAAVPVMAGWLRTLPGGLDLLADAITAVMFGIAAVWLLSDHLRRSHRLLTFLCALLVMAVFAGIALASRLGVGWQDEMLQIAIVAGLGVLASSLALILCGWICCRRQFSPVRIYPWLVASLLVVWLLVTAPLVVLAIISSGNQIPWGEILVPILAVAAGNFVLLLPFLLLSSANPFFRERVKALLNAAPEAPSTLAPNPQPSQ